MKFLAGAAPVTNAGTNPDPFTSPATVPDSNLIGHDGMGPHRVGTTQRLLLGFEGSAPGTTTTVSIYVLDEDSVQPVTVPADRKFYLIEAGIVLTHQTLYEVDGPVPARGQFYIRQTAGSANGVVRIAPQEG